MCGVVLVSRAARVSGDHPNCRKKHLWRSSNSLSALFGSPHYMLEGMLWQDGVVSCLDLEHRVDQRASCATRSSQQMFAHAAWREREGERKMCRGLLKEHFFWDLTVAR